MSSLSPTTASRFGVVKLVGSSSSPEVLFTVTEDKTRGKIKVGSRTLEHNTKLGGLEGEVRNLRPTIPPNDTVKEWSTTIREAVVDCLKRIAQFPAYLSLMSNSVDVKVGTDGQGFTTLHYKPLLTAGSSNVLTLPALSQDIEA